MNYRDLPFRIIASVIAALLASELGSSHSLAQRLHTPEFYLEFGVSFAITIIVVTIVSRATRFLDRRFDWFQRTVGRIALQIAWGVLVPALVVFLSASGYFAYFGINIFRTDYLYFAFPYIILLIVIFNVYYYTYYLFLRLKKEKAELEDISNSSPKRDYRQQIKAYDGIATIVLQVSQIAYIFLEGRQVIIRDKDGKDFLTDGVLDDIESEIDPTIFFRLNRQLIVSRDSCNGYTPIEFGKIQVPLSPGFTGDTIVSQRKAPTFKKWYLDR
jgi:DNA-binding LytR/AlgR family response regulator